MRIAGTTTLAAAPDAVRAVLADPERLGELLPNVEGFVWEEAPGGAFSAVIRPALALGEIPVRTVWEPLDGDGDGGLRYRVEGRTDEHRVAFDVALAISGAAAGGGSLVAWELDLHVTGTLRSAGQRVLVPIVDRQVRTVLAAAGEEAAP